MPGTLPMMTTRWLTLVTACCLAGCAYHEVTFTSAPSGATVEADVSALWMVPGDAERTGITPCTLRLPFHCRSATVTWPGAGRQVVEIPRVPWHRQAARHTGSLTCGCTGAVAFGLGWALCEAGEIYGLVLIIPGAGLLSLAEWAQVETDTVHADRIRPVKREPD